MFDNKKYCKQWRKDNPNYDMQYQLKRKYNISYEDWVKMWEYQDGRCAICGKSFNKPSDSCVDHNHKTDEIRGLLCRKCNLGIGHFYDNIELLIKVIKYLTGKIL